MIWWNHLRADRSHRFFVLPPTPETFPYSRLLSGSGLPGPSLFAQTSLRYSRCLSYFGSSSGTQPLPPLVSWVLLDNSQPLWDSGFTSAGYGWTGFKQALPVSLPEALKWVPNVRWGESIWWAVSGKAHCVWFSVFISKYVKSSQLCLEWAQHSWL